MKFRMHRQQAEPAEDRWFFASKLARLSPQCHLMASICDGSNGHVWRKTLILNGAPGRGRTGTTVRSRDFKSLASTNFATGAELCLAATAARMLILPDPNLLRRDQSVGVNDLCFSLQHVL